MSRELSRRSFLKQAGTAALAVTVCDPFIRQTFAAKGCYPSGTNVRWIVPFSPGGGYNVYSRMIEPFIEDEVGAELVVENISGAGGGIGSTQIFQSKPNGRTVGLLNAGGVVMAGIAGELDFTIDQYTIFGRIVDTRQVICVGKPTYEKGIRTIKDALNTKQPLLWGATGPSSNGFFGAAVLGHILGINRKFVSGYPGSTEVTLAATKGDVDLIEFTFSSIQTAVEAGDVIPLAIVGPKIPDHKIFKGKKIPTVMEVAKMVGADLEDALGAAEVTAAGRVIAGPPNIPAKIADCFAKGTYRAMTHPGFKAIAAGARRPIDPIDSDEARKAMQRASKAARKHKAIWEQAVKELGT